MTGQIPATDRGQGSARQPSSAAAPSRAPADPVSWVLRCLAAVMVAGLLAGTVAHPVYASTPVGPSGSAQDAIIQPILFVPAGLRADPSYPPAIDSGLLAIAAWFARELDGQTIQPLPVRTVAGRYPLARYCPKTIDASQCIQVPGQLGADPGDGYNVLRELAADGYGIKPGVILLVFWVGGYGYAGGFQSSPGSGAAILADWALSGISGARVAENRCADASVDPCLRGRALGATAHELGHALGLPHPTDDGRLSSDPDWFLRSVMSSAMWDFPSATFIDSPTNPERTTLAANPQLHASVNPTCPFSPAPDPLVPLSFAVGALCESANISYSLSGLAGQTVKISAGAIPPMRPRLTLRGPCDPTGGMAVIVEGEERLTAKLPCAGIYSLEVASSTGDLGAFALRVDLPFPPTSSLTPLPAWLPSTSIPIAWGATPGDAAVSSYDVRYRRAPWNGGFGSYVTWQSATSATGATLAGSAGSTYCFSVRARDALGSLSTWTSETCTAVPLDDRSLSRSGTWAAGTGSAYYRSTYLRSSAYGAKLVRTGVIARRIAIVATTCPACGSVRVYWGSTLLRTISLKSAATVNGKLIAVTTFTAPRSGTLAITISSSGKEVVIDGVAIRRN